MAVKKASSATGRGKPVKKAAPAGAAVPKPTTQARGARGNAPRADSEKAPAKKSAASMAGARKAGAQEAGAQKTAARRVATKSPVKGAATSVKTASRRSAPTPGAPKAGAAAQAATKVSAVPQRLRVRENEKPWTTRELAEVRADLEADVARLKNEISTAELDLVDLMRDAGEGAGDDQADAGTATFEREQEISLANNAREVFEQSARALARLIDDSYGICESCGSPIGKNRLLAFPRATLCLTCKSKQERR